MDVFRNPEYKKCIIIDVSVTSVAVIVSAFLNIYCSVIIILLSAVMMLSQYYLIKNRIERINQITCDIDKVLHGNDNIDFSDYCEGELAILKSEIEKMVIRLREQNAALLDDKKELANSIADISHQIRTPLTSINLIVRLLSDPNCSDVRKKELYSDLNNQLKRIEWLVSALLKMSKLDAQTVEFKKENILLSELIKKASEPVLISMDLRDQKLIIKNDKTTGFTGDMMWSVEAITNIIKNCMEHTPKGGTIKISTNENAVYTQIVISDTGAGISKQDMPNLFKRFYKGKNSAESSVGIGLALSRMIISKQNGIIKAQNNISGIGASFIIRFYKGIV